MFCLRYELIIPDVAVQGIGFVSCYLYGHPQGGRRPDFGCVSLSISQPRA